MLATAARSWRPGGASSGRGVRGGEPEGRARAAAELASVEAALSSCRAGGAAVSGGGAPLLQQRAEEGRKGKEEDRGRFVNMENFKGVSGK